ncbi:FAD-dependent oxidoreductase [Chitinophaga nivalis]|uniref:FAD-dependent oxidoreductase n=1 Tax=Chitinophaga nivalis TaxID=2991709 RepID=A0ABT3IJB2_9BACT|nr:FAD-dependent oxidoreductase [Chitinophaga nivalis]MCW3466298.1 FAD-dependent oxidoreductase [Chitinophaga nivalis]MCW3484011.1 FAD-dependent oxidoreductase [Chitinophaga nivalis]
MKSFFKQLFLLISGLTGNLIPVQAQTVREVDVCIYGATAAGVVAAYTAQQLHKTVLLIEPGRHLGGLTAGGLGYTDIGNKYAITGLSRDFYRRVGQHYGRLEQWIFEPHVATQILQQYLNRAGITVQYRYRLQSVSKTNGYITDISLQPTTDTAGLSPFQVKAKMFIDCSYEGDLMAGAGVTYTIGREANSQYTETYNGVQLRDIHQFPDSIDPYRVPGDPASGLLWGISADTLATKGSADQKVQAYNFRICLTKDSANRISVTRPLRYDSSRYELLLRVVRKLAPTSLAPLLKIDLMPNNKTDINNKGPFSTDMIGANYAYPEASYQTRRQLIQEHEDYTKGLLYFIGNDSRMPLHLRQEMLQWGYPKDEYTDNGNWTPQLYIREARRMVSDYVMTQANCEGRQKITDTAGMAAYTMDSHNCQRLVVKGMVKNEGDVQIGGFGPYPIAYRSIVPKSTEVKNLLVPVCLSASHIAYGSIRMEPVFMVLAQSAATAAVMCADSNRSVQQLNVTALQRELQNNPLADGSTPDILVDNDDTARVKLVGVWNRYTPVSYGPSAFTTVATATSPLKTARFTPLVKQAGSYHVYTYIPKIPGLAPAVEVNIFDSTTLRKQTIAPASVVVLGQTTGEWLDLGVVTLPAGTGSYVEISNNKAIGIVVADAVLLIKQ